MKRLFIPLLCMFLLLFAAPAPAGADESFAVVNNPDPADRLNLRKNAHTESISLGKFYNGTPVTVEAIYDGWAKVTLYKDFGGYMKTEFLAFGDDAQNVQNAMPRVTVTAPMGKTIHRSMFDTSTPVASFPIGSQLEVMGAMEDWLFVRAGDTLSGFTSNDGTMPCVYFSAPSATPRIPVVATPTPSPTPLPTAASEELYASVPIEGARNITDNDWIIFASLNQDTTLYADRALTQAIGQLRRGELVRIFNGVSTYATYVKDGRIAGYFPAAQNLYFENARWPFHVDQPSAAVNDAASSDRLHLRESPSRDARSLGLYYNGTVVTLLDNFDGKDTWTHVRIGDVSGYMMSKYLTFSPDLGELFSQLSLYEVRNPSTGDLHLRSAPSTGAKSLGLYKNGTLVSVIGLTGDWVHVICEGQMGFMLHKALFTSEGTSFEPYP